MDVTPLVRQGQKIIQSYAKGRFRVSGDIHEGAIIVRPNAVSEWACDWQAGAKALCLSDFQLFLDQKNEIDVVLLGAGASMADFPMTLRVDLKKAGLNVDVMDTGAACRTYNVLMAEGRRVAAALLPSV